MENKDEIRQIRELGAAGLRGIHCLTIIGQIEGHQLLAEDAKTTKYEHILPMLAAIEESEEIRFQTGMSELDRVLGGGAVQGSLVLIGGAPGIGKSTLMLQICDNLCRFATVLYVSG